MRRGRKPEHQQAERFDEGHAVVPPDGFLLMALLTFYEPMTTAFILSTGLGIYVAALTIIIPITS